VSATRAIYSIITVTHDSLPAFRDCLRSLEQSSARDLSELIVVDNHSADNSVDIATELFPDASIIRNEQNAGFASACNQGASVASGEYLVFLNPDVRLDPNAIEQLRQGLESRPHVGLAAGRLRFPDGRFQESCRKLPTVTNLLFSRGSSVGRLFAGGSKSHRPMYTLPDYDQITEVPATAATYVMIRLELFERVGGFDTRFFLFMEDTDLCLRLGQSGYSILFVPAAGAVHEWGRGGNMGRIKRAWHHHVSVWRYFLKHLPNGFSLVILPVLLMVNFLIICISPGKRSAE